MSATTLFGSIWSHTCRVQFSRTGSSVTWPRRASAGRTGLSALVPPLTSPLLWVRGEQRDVGQARLPGTPERDSHSMAVLTAALRDHMCLWLSKVSNPPWLSRALSTKSNSLTRPRRALVPFLLAISPVLSLSLAPLS